MLRVERGCLILQSVDPDGSRHLAMVLLPGDAICREAAPPLPGLVLSAATQASLLRLSANLETERGAEGEQAAARIGLARLAARMSLQTLSLCELTAEQRLATFLVQLALCFGHGTPTGCALELPLSRTEMAHHLALNPDTMSRLLSGLRGRKLIAMPSRRWVTIASMPALAAISPLAPALRLLWPDADCGIELDGRTAAARRA